MLSLQFGIAATTSALPFICIYTYHAALVVTPCVHPMVDADFSSCCNARKQRSKQNVNAHVGLLTERVGSKVVLPCVRACDKLN